MSIVRSIRRRKKARQGTMFEQAKFDKPAKT